MQDLSKTENQAHAYMKAKAILKRMTNSGSDEKLGTGRFALAAG